MARYNWCLGPVLGCSPVLRNHWPRLSFVEILNLSNTFPSSANTHLRILSFPKLQTHLRFQHGTALKPLPRLISLDWTSPYDISAFSFYSLYSLSIAFATINVFSITVCFPEQSDIKYTWMPSPVYQNRVNLILSRSIWRCQTKFMTVIMWEHNTFVESDFWMWQDLLL
jgi:hypothetical protein